MAGDIAEQLLESLDETRRSFLSKLILGSAFAAPTVASFSMSGLAVGQIYTFCSNLTGVHCSNQSSGYKQNACNLIRDGATGIDFGGCPYAGQDFHGFTLQHNCFEGTDFTGANLSHSDFSFSNLSGATLSGANLNGAILEQVFLNGAVLAGANLNNANLHSAQLEGAVLTGANLHGADLSNANLSNSVLTGANLHGANLTNVVWCNTTCPDGTNSDGNGGFCLIR